MCRGEPDKHRLEEIVSELVRSSPARIHAYCWLPNEIELLLDPGDWTPQSIADHIGARYSESLGEAAPERRAPELFDLALTEVLDRDWFAGAAPRTRKHLVEILKLGADWR